MTKFRFVLLPRFELPFRGWTLALLTGALVGSAPAQSAVQTVPDAAATYSLSLTPTPAADADATYTVTADMAPGIANPTDLDIFATLVRDAVREAYRWPDDVVRAHPQWGDVSVGEVHAVQLPGKGVVLVIDAPPLGSDDGPPAKEEEGARFHTEEDTWEQTRRRIQGQPQPPQNAQGRNCRACHMTDDQAGAPSANSRWPSRFRLVRAISDVVAAHGRRIQELGAEESLWIGVNFAQPGRVFALNVQPSNPNQAQDTLEPGVLGSINVTAESLTWGRPELRGPLSSSGVVRIEPPRPDGVTPGETAADLHLRQGNFVKAAELYQQAIDSGRRDSDAYAKLLRAYVMLGQTDRADQVLSQWKTLRDKPAEAPTASGKPAARQLVVEFKKLAIDSVGEGGIPLDLFVEHALQMTTTFPKTKPAEPPALAEPAKE